MVKRGQESDAEQVIHNVRAQMEAEMRRTNEVPDDYHFDVIGDRKAVRVGDDFMVPGLGNVPADVVTAGLVIAWRKGTEKPRFSVKGQLA
jgi:hypothetical protein